MWPPNGSFVGSSPEPAALPRDDSQTAQLPQPSLAVGRRGRLWLAVVGLAFLGGSAGSASGELLVGVAETDITPPVGFPMAGYYHERLAVGALDPLQARAIVFREGQTEAAVVVCDLIGIATDLTQAVRARVEAATGMPGAHIAITATHSHTAPDYMRELYLFLGQEPQEELRAQYIEQLIQNIADAVMQARDRARPTRLTAGYAIQETPVSFNRRFIMRDGSVQTWQSVSNPEVIRAAGPIDPEIGLLLMYDLDAAQPRAALSNFALHLDTVGGTSWSADYPRFIEQALQEQYGPEFISVFGTGCCGDINHVNPASTDRNSAAVIGQSLAASVLLQEPKLPEVSGPGLFVETTTVQLPLQAPTATEVNRAVELLAIARAGGQLEFLEHVTAYKHVILDQLRNEPPQVNAADHITWGLSRSLAGVGAEIPVDLTVIALSPDVAIVCVPGEVFVNLGLAIKQGSPFQTTLVIELANNVETIYVPHRGAYAGGSYEVTNSNVQPGSGEMLVEAALRSLRQAAGQFAKSAPAP